MSEAENLLNSLSTDDIELYTLNSEVEGHIVIGNDRIIVVPYPLKRIAVQYDHNAETVTFDCPRYWDEHDLSKMHIYINYLKPDGAKGRYLAKNLVVDKTDSNLIHFEWTIGNEITYTTGTLQFLVCAVKTDSEGIEEVHWNTEINTEMYISSGLECTDVIPDAYPDIINDLFTKMDTIIDTNAEIIANDEALATRIEDAIAYNDELVEAAEKVANANDELVGRIETAEAIVDDNNTRVDNLTTDFYYVKDEVLDVAEVEDSSITINDSALTRLKEVTVEGKSYQETRSGRNLYDYKNINNIPSGLTYDEDGWITATYDNTNGTSSKYLNYWTRNLDLKPDTQYLIVTEIKSFSGVFGQLVTASSQIPTNVQTSGQFEGSIIYNFGDITSGSIKTATRTTIDDFATLTESSGLRTFVLFRPGESGSVTFRISVLEDTTVTANTFEYEAYGATPTPEIPSEIKSVGYKNHLPFTDQDFTIKGVRIYVINGDLYLDGTSTGEINSDTVEFKNNFSFTLPAGTYRFSRGVVAGDILIVPMYIRKYDDDTVVATNSTTFTLTEETTLYLGLYIYQKSFDNVKLDSRLTQGSIARNYVPSGKYGITVKTSGKNLAKLTKGSYTQSGVTVTNNGDGTYTFNGTSTSAFDNNLITSDNDYIKIYTGKFYRLSLKVISGTKNDYLTNANARLVVGDTKKWAWLSDNSEKAKSSNDNGYIDYINYYISQGVIFNNYRIGIQIEIVDNENSSATELEPYQEMITTLASPEPLYDLPNGVKDEIKVVNGRVKLVKNVEEIIFNGNANTEWWTLHKVTDNCTAFRLTKTMFVSNGSYSANTIPNVKSQEFKSTTWYKAYSEDFIDEGVCTHNKDSSMYIVINTSRLSDVSTYDLAVSSFKTWLSNNNVKVYYETATPREIDLGVIDMPVSYHTVTNVFTDQELEPNVIVQYHRTLKATVQNLQINNQALKQELADLNARLSALESAN